MKFLIKIAIPLLLCTACKQEKNCLDYNGNSGIIIESIDMGACYTYLTGTGFLVKDTNDYKKLPNFTNDSVQEDLGCPGNPARPEIDFEEKALIGARTFAEGCTIGYEREATFDSVNKVIVYKINVHQCGDCNDKRYSMNWVLIPNIPEADSLYVNINYL